MSIVLRVSVVGRGPLAQPRAASMIRDWLVHKPRNTGDLYTNRNRVAWCYREEHCSEAGL